MDARDLPTISSLANRRPAQAGLFVLAALIAWALWAGYGALLFAGDVH